MAIGERIHFFRNLRGMTQKYLGQMAGFPERSADIRMAQYESGTRSPKADVTEKYLRAGKSFEDAPEEDKNFLQLFSFICMLSYDIYIRKQIIEKIVDNLPKQPEK